MKIHTEHIVLNVPKDMAFAYIADYENIPKWSKNFILKLEKNGSKYTATTPVGKMKFEIVSDKNTGVIDLLLDGKPSSTRLVALGADMTLYSFTLILPPNMSEEEFRGGIKGLQEELALLKNQLEK